MTGLLAFEANFVPAVGLKVNDLSFAAAGVIVAAVVVVVAAAAAAVVVTGLPVGSQVDLKVVIESDLALVHG